MTDSFLTRWERVIKATPSMHQRIADEVPQLKRGIVWCHKCGHSEKADSAHCLAHGWPLHCGQTMSIDSPEERGGARP